MSHHSLARVDLAAVAGSLWQPSLASCQAAKEASLHQQRDRIGCNSCLKPEPKVPPQLSSPTSYADEIPDMLGTAQCYISLCLLAYSQSVPLAMATSSLFNTPLTCATCRKKQTF
eukprot:scaffold182747_cov18-Tisochrysis_lutea.AAC.2